MFRNSWLALYKTIDHCIRENKFISFRDILNEITFNKGRHCLWFILYMRFYITLIIINFINSSGFITEWNFYYIITFIHLNLAYTHKYKSLIITMTMTWYRIITNLIIHYTSTLIIPGGFITTLYCWLFNWARAVALPSLADSHNLSI